MYVYVCVCRSNHFVMHAHVCVCRHRFPPQIQSGDAQVERNSRPKKKKRLQLAIPPDKVLFFFSSLFVVGVTVTVICKRRNAASFFFFLHRLGTLQHAGIHSIREKRMHFLLPEKSRRVMRKKKVKKTKKKTSSNSLISRFAHAAFTKNGTILAQYTLGLLKRLHHNVIALRNGLERSNPW